MSAFAERRILRWLALPVLGMWLGVLAVAYGALAQMHTRLPLADDFYSFYVSAQRVTQGQSPYWPLLPRRQEADPCHALGALAFELASVPVAELTPELALMCRAPNLNPPILAVLSQPLAWVGPGPAANLWMALGLVSLAGALWSMSRALWPASPAPVKLCAGLWLAVLSWFPSWLSVLVGQVTLVLSWPLVLSWLALRQGRWGRAGALIGLLCSIKLFFGLLPLGLLLMRQWRALAVTVVTGLLLAAWGAWGSSGWGAYRDYAASLDAVIWVSNNFNASLHGYVSRFFVDPDKVFWAAVPREARGLSWLACCGVAGLWWRGVSGGRARLDARLGPAGPSGARAAQADLLFTLSLPAMLLISPLGWVYYFPWLVLPLALVWQAAAAHPARRQVGAVLILLVSLAAVPRSLMSHPPLRWEEWLLDWGGYTYLLLLALGLAWWARGDAARRGAV